MKRKWLSVLMAASMIASMAVIPAAAEEDVPDNEVTGDASADDAFVIWGWNTDFVTLQGLLEEQYPELEGRIVFVNTGGSGYYQDKLDAILADPDNELYPDIVLLEVGYVQKYVQSDYLLSLEDLGITSEDTASQFTYNIELGSDADGVQKASFWQATPGCLQIRADLAETYLGTTDQAELEEMFSNWDSILEIAEQVNEASGGMVKLFSGYDDLKYIFLNGSRSVGWYDESDVIQVDDAMVEYMELSKTLYEEDLTFNTTMWDTDWAAQKDGDGVDTEAAIVYCGCPWYTYWSLTDTWNGNTILVDAPTQFYWGGTGLAATVGCSDTEVAAQIISACTTDADFMVSIYGANGDYVNNTEAISTIIDEGIESTSGFTLYGDQNIAEYFSSRGEGIDVSVVTAEDQVICETLFPAAVTAYATGASDLDTAIADFKASVHDTYDYLSVE
ncbi:MAG: hypothetical protein LUH07_10950 [Lachnospiraceae bacterium]|nr:hypothetical protein [Lachnospiraceae bacterium]